MGILREFKEFATRGNVMDLAVGIIIGGAFGKIVSSLVADILMPPIGLIVGGIRFTDLKFRLRDAVVDPTGKVLKEAVTLNIGNFMQATFDFLIISGAIFFIVKVMNKLNRKKAEEPAPPVLSEEVRLLTEIRDILKNN
jgi:large conductance mechanosensitive channel protein